MSTIKQQLMERFAETEPGASPEILVCLYRPMAGHRLYEGSYIWNEPPPPMIRCGYDGLPEREFDAGYGGVEGEPCIAFSARYIYIRSVYDGSEHFCAVPRTPEVAVADDYIPEAGGG